MDIPDPVVTDKPAVGVDLGIQVLATVSDGEVFPNPKALKRHLRKVKRLQRSVSRKMKGSANRRKAVQKLARAHLHVANIRKDTLHQVTTELAKTKSVVVLENLNVAGMLKNHSLAGAINDVGLREFRRMMEYKGQWYGCTVLAAPTFYPSSKTCSACGYVKQELTLYERVFVCEACGQTLDRDLNAALNLAVVAVSSTQTLNACGGERFMVRQVLLNEAGTEHRLGLS
jgi:putative transposase